MMMSLVIGLRHYLQVFYSVIIFYSINMMNYFIWPFKLSFEKFLHDNSVLWNPFTPRSMNNVSIIESADSLRPSLENVRLISFKSPVMFYTKSFSEERFFAFFNPTQRVIFWFTHVNNYIRNGSFGLCSI